jgi:Uma2 family endonuclease
MLARDVEEVLAEGGFRGLKRREFDALVAQGCFDDERVELLYGMVVPMSPIDPAHREAVTRLQELLIEQLRTRARVRIQSLFAATDDSDPEPDVSVIPNRRFWQELPDHAFLVVEVARTSLRRDRAKQYLYAKGNVDEYWVVNHAEACIVVFRDARDGAWQTKTTHGRGEVLSPLAFPDVRIPVDEILPPRT